MNTKAQLSIFIIIALVLLLSVGSYLYLTQSKEAARFDVQRPIIQKAPQEFLIVTDYITNCLHETAKTAIKLLGESGGYIDTTKIQKNPFEPTESQGVELSPGSELIVPYWFYLKDKNTCEGTCAFDTKKLPIKKATNTLSIEGQIDEYINKNIALCTKNFAQLEKQKYKIVAIKEPKATTTITQDDIFVTLNYPITATKAEQTYKTDKFITSLQVNFREVYELAEKLTELQEKNRYLEKDIRELIDSFSRLDKEALPPVSDLRFDFGIGTLWIKIELEQKLKEMLTTYMSLLQVAGTITHQYIKAPPNILDKELFEILYNRGMIIPLEKNHPTLGVRYTYLDWWKPYLDISGCRGQVCQPESFGTTLMLIFGIQRYNFAYDISLPVLVEINSPNAFKGEGYTFNFALEANLRNNRPMPAEFAPLKPISSVSMATMFCDEDKRFGGELNLTLIDGKTNKGLDDALITYSCAGTSCAIGTTNKGNLKTKMPKCLGGIISAEKYEHHPVYAPFDTFTAENQNLTLIIEPYRQINFSVKKYLLKKGLAWELDMNNPEQQANDEQTLITMEKKTLPYEEPFTAFAEVFGGPLSKEKDYSKEIRLIPGTYDVKLYMIKYPKPAIIIPREKRCFKGGLLDEKDCVFVPDESIEFYGRKVLPNGKIDQKPLPNGGAEFELTLTADELNLAKSIQWKVLNFALDKVPESDRRIEDLDQIGKLHEYSEQVKDQLKPEIILR